MWCLCVFFGGHALRCQSLYGKLSQKGHPLLTYLETKPPLFCHVLDLSCFHSKDALLAGETAPKDMTTPGDFIL